MILTILPHQFKLHYLIFSDPIKNNIMDNSIFIRISYSPPNVHFIGLYILIQDVNDIYLIEEQILNAYNVHNKELNYTIFSNLKYKVLPLNSYIKISGLWENDTTIGIAYKIIHYPSVL